jgi:hypothetical protein
MIFFAHEQFEGHKVKKSNPFFTYVRILCLTWCDIPNQTLHDSDIVIVNADNHTQVTMRKKKKENRKMSCFVSQRPNIVSA